MYLDKEIKPDTSVVADNIDKTIELLKSGKHCFDMNHWCDCIGGHAVRACLGVIAPILGSDIEKTARNLLGIDRSQAHALFGGRPATRQQAIATLARLKDTGKVSWTK